MEAMVASNLLADYALDNLNLTVWNHFSPCRDAVNAQFAAEHQKNGKPT
jgi:hypothetical protein